VREREEGGGKEGDRGGEEERKEIESIPILYSS